MRRDSALGALAIASIIALLAAATNGASTSTLVTLLGGAGLGGASILAIPEKPKEEKKPTAALPIRTPLQQRGNGEVRPTVKESFDWLEGRKSDEIEWEVPGIVTVRGKAVGFRRLEDKAIEEKKTAAVPKMEPEHLES